MKRVLLFALLGFTLAGCTEPSRSDVPVVPESAAAPLGQIPPSAKPADTAVAAPPPAQTLAEPKPTAPTTATPSTSAAPLAAVGDGGAATKPGTCLKDTDCSTGQVCDACAEGKCCAQGCHTDAQCAVGQHCRQVACVRAPCPSKCEGGSAPPQGGPPGKPDSKSAPVK